MIGVGQSPRQLAFANQADGTIGLGLAAIRPDLHPEWGQQAGQPPADGAIPQHHHRLTREDRCGEAILQITPVPGSVLIAELRRQVPGKSQHAREHVLRAGIRKDR